MASRRTYKKKGSRKHKSSKRHHRKHHIRHAKKNMIIMGGDGGSTGYAQGVYGGIGQQEAESSSNVISMNAQYANSMRGGANPLQNQVNLEGMNPQQVVTGGQEQQQLQQGGEVLTEVAVPVALLALNQGLVPKRRTGKNRHHRSHRRYRR
jgi:hypothetical protein